MTSLAAVCARFARTEGLPFADILTEVSIRDVLNEHGARGGVPPNCRTLQMLSFAARLSSGGVSYGRKFESQEASWSSCVQ